MESQILNFIKMHTVIEDNKHNGTSIIGTVPGYYLKSLITENSGICSEVNISTMAPRLINEQHKLINDYVTNMNYKYPCLDGMIDSNSNLSEVGSSFDVFDTLVVINGREFGKLNPDSDDVQFLISHANNAGYGDIRNKKTSYDPRVRKALSIDDFQVPDDVVEMVKDLWEARFPHSDVTVSPYKINIYRTGDHFKLHKDTPSKNLVGTFLISLLNNSETGKLEFVFQESANLDYLDNQIFSHWDEKYNDWVAFYPDIMHKVSPILEEGRFRINISFKIFSNNYTFNQEHIDYNLEKLIKLGNIGIILNHQYSKDTSPNALKGIDYHLYNSFENLQSKFNFKLMVIPVQLNIDYNVHQREEINSEDEHEENNHNPQNQEPIGELEVKVCSIVDVEIPDINYFPINKRKLGYLISHDSNTEGYLGNEYDENSHETSNFVYLSRALVVIVDDTPQEIKTTYNLN